MSATQTLLKPQEKQGTWSHIFPNETVTEQKSALFVKKLLAVAVSNITYLRAIFPEGAYGDRCLEDLNLKILKDESSCPNACQVIRWVKGCFDALDKKFLRLLTIGIYTDHENPETVIESYTFKFSYADSGGIDIYRNKDKISSAYTAAETKKATIQLLRTIVVLTQSLKSLPDDVMMTMKLHYYDEITPADYEPPGFIAADSGNFNFEEEPMNIKVGDVATPFHTVKLRIKTDSRQFEEVHDSQSQVESTQPRKTKVPEDKAAKQNDEPVVIDQEICNSGLDETEEDREVAAAMHKETKGKKKKPTKSKRESDEQRVPCTPPQPKEADSVPGDVEAKHPEEQAIDSAGSQLSQVNVDNGVRCGCGCNEDDGLMILCAICQCWQHGVCYKVIDDEEAPERHICELCANEDDPILRPTDPYFNNMSEFAIQAACLWRRALFCCSEFDKMTAPTMSKRLGIEMAIAQGLVSRLEKESFLKPRGKRFGKPVDKEKLQLGIKKYFKKQQSLDKRDRDEEMDTDISVTKSAKDSEKISEIDKLTQKAEALDVSGKKKLKSEKRNDKKSLLKRKNSRVKAVMDGEEYEFDVEESQELSQEGEPSRKKKRKFSVVTNPLLV